MKRDGKGLDSGFWDCHDGWEWYSPYGMELPADYVVIAHRMDYISNWKES